MNANMYDGVSTAGPVPTIFSDDQQATIDAMVSDPAQAHKDVTKINSIFVMPEVLKPAACGSLIKKPREGTGIAKFKRGRWSASDESPPKKQKSSHTDSGTAHSKSLL
jgi:hypothetical protein